MTPTPDPTKLANSFVHLIQRFTGNQPDALAQMRNQIEVERDAGRNMMERAEAQLTALDELQALIGQATVDDPPPLGIPSPPLKTAILRVLNDDPETAWHRDSLYAEIVRRGWGPGGSNPRNTFTSRLRDLEIEGLLRRIDRNTFASKKEVPAT
jgi:hypothetical protein